MTSNLDDLLLGKFCIVFLMNTQQPIIFSGKHLTMAATVDGMITRITKDHIFISDGKSDDPNKVIARKAIAYIHIEPEEEDGIGMLSLSDFGEEDGGAHH